MLFSATKSAMAVGTGALTTTGPAGATLIEIDPPANRVALLKQWWVAFKGVSATDPPVNVQLCILSVTSAAGTALTPVSMRIGQPVAVTTAKTLPATEGTSAALEEQYIPPTTGYMEQYPLGEEPQLLGAAATAIGYALRGDRGSGAAVNAAAGLQFEE